MAQSGGCERFEVGSRQWTQCVEDQATGGGLMPWIVVVPLGVMVVGMMIGFARQFSDAGRDRARAHGAAGTAGTWLLFVASIELAIGIGSWVAASRAPGEGGGYAIAATVLLGVGVLLLVVGLYLKVRGRRRAHIFHSGLPGEAVIRAVHETGTMVNNQPMYAFDVDVSGSGFAPTSTRVREVVPFWFLNRVGPDARVPVKVDPSDPRRIIFDWDGFRGGVAGAAPVASALATGRDTSAGDVLSDMATGTMPGGETVADALRMARELGGPTSGRWHLGKAIVFAVALFVLLIVGGGLYVFGQVFGQVSDVTNEVVDQVEDARERMEGALGGRGGGGAGATTLEVSRAARGRGPVAYSVALPAGWNDLTEAVEEDQGAVLVDVVMKPQAVSEARIVVTRSARYLQRPAPDDATIETVRRGIEREFGDALVRSRPIRLGGEPAVAMDLAPGADGLRSRQVAVVQGGQVLFVSLTAPRSEWPQVLPVFEAVLASWQWGPVSA